MLGADGPLTGTERAVLGVDATDEAARFIGDYCREVLGGSIERVLLRAGRIDVVWGVELGDGRRVAVKVHRPPSDLDVLRSTREAVAFLVRSGFPAPEPLSGPDERSEGRVVTADELLLEGTRPDASTPNARRLLARGLHEHVMLLRERPELLDRSWPGPSWCRYGAGPWPVSHDPIVDLRDTPPEFAWLDDLARRASEQILAHRGEDEVLGHADWYAGNVAAEGERLVATFDWELVADAEAVVAGFAAASFAGDPDSSAGLSSSAAARAFLLDYAELRGDRWTPDEWRAAAGAVTWILTFDARWQVGLYPHGLGDPAIVERLRLAQDEYLAIGA